MTSDSVALNRASAANTGIGLILDSWYASPCIGICIGKVNIWTSPSKINKIRYWLVPSHLNGCWVLWKIIWMTVFIYKLYKRCWESLLSGPERSNPQTQSWNFMVTYYLFVKPICGQKGLSSTSKTGCCSTHVAHTSLILHPRSNHLLNVEKTSFSERHLHMKRDLCQTASEVRESQV